MNKKEAKIVLKILNQADGSCSHCAIRLYDSFLRAFPKFKPEAEEVWKNEWEYDLDDALKMED